MPLHRAQFQDLFEAQRDRVFRFLYRLTGNAADADDLLQDAFLAAWRNRMQFQERGSSAGWLLRTAFRLYLNSRRKRVRRGALAGKREPSPAAAPWTNGHEVPDDTTHGPENRDAMSFVLARVNRAVSALPEGPREAFVMFRFEGMPVSEIAEVVGAPLKTVETRIRRATQLLAQELSALREHLPAS